MGAALDRIKLRSIAPADREFLYQVYASSRAEELAPVPWPPEQKEAFLRFQFEAQHQHYQSNYRQAEWLIILHDGEPAGRLYVDRRENEIRVIDIALMPEYRGRGIGSALLGGIMEEAGRGGKSVSLHVENFNPARHLYERLGFRTIGESGVYQLMEWRAA